MNMLVTGMGKQKCNLTSVTLPKAAEAEGGFWLIFLASEEMKPHRNPANFIKILTAPEINISAGYHCLTNQKQWSQLYCLYIYYKGTQCHHIFYFFFKHSRSWLYIEKVLLAREETSQNASQNYSGHICKWKWRTDERVVEKEAVEWHKKKNKTNLEYNTTWWENKILSSWLLNTQMWESIWKSEMFHFLSSASLQGDSFNLNRSD